MLTIRADQLKEADLLGLVAARATENDRLDFKRDMYGNSDGQIADMIRDITAMANQRGGVILIGVDEDGDGVATGVQGVEGTGHVERITSSTQANISPRLNGLAVVPVPLENGRAVIAIEIPESLNRPHMVTFRSENRFWRREIRQKVMMSVEEVERAFMMRSDQAGRAEEFIERRRLTPNANSVEPTVRALVLQAIPVFVREELFDIRDRLVLEAMERPPVHPESMQLGCDAGTPRPSLYGLMAESRDESGRALASVELRREGYLEFRAVDFIGFPAAADEAAAVPSRSILYIVYSFAHLYQHLFRQVSLSTPAIFALTLANVSGCHLALPRRLTRQQGQVWLANHVAVPPVYVQDASANADAVVRRLNDRLWNAFGLPSCLLLREDGSVLPD